MYYDIKKIEREITTLLESISNDRIDLSTKRLTVEERKRKLEYINWCIGEINRQNEIAELIKKESALRLT